MTEDKEPKVTAAKKYAPPFSVRLTLADVATIEELNDAVETLTEAMARIEAKLDDRAGPTT